MGVIMSNARQIIDRFGGQSALAALLGRRQSTVHHWARTGRIPSQWHEQLMELAVQQGVSLEPKDFVASSAPSIRPAGGKLGVLLVGLGAVSSTFIAGVEHIRRGTGQPVGSVTQLATIRLGKRSDKRTPLIRDLVPLAELDDLVFGAWDPIPDNAYEAAVKSGVLDRHEQIEPVADFLKSIAPMPAVFGKDYVKRIEGSNTKVTGSRLASVEAIRDDIRRFKEENDCDRLVMVWCASTEKFITETEAHQTIENFVGGLHDDDESIAPSMVYAYAALMEGVPFVNGAPNLTVDIPALERLAKDGGVPICGKDFKTGQTLVKTVIGPMLKARMLGLDGWFSTNILGNRDGEVLDEPENFKTKEESKLGVLEIHPAAGRLSGAILGRLPQGAYQLLPSARRQQGGLGQHRHLRLARPPDAAQGQLPVLGLDTGRPLGAGPRAVQGPGAARGNGRHPGVAVLLLQEPAATPRQSIPSTTLFIQQTKLKNTLRWLMGEEQITHLGMEYYRGD